MSFIQATQSLSEGTVSSYKQGYFAGVRTPFIARCTRYNNM